MPVIEFYTPGRDNPQVRSPDLLEALHHGVPLFLLGVDLDWHKMRVDGFGNYGR